MWDILTLNLRKHIWSRITCGCTQFLAAYFPSPSMEILCHVYNEPFVNDIYVWNTKQNIKLCELTQKVRETYTKVDKMRPKLNVTQMFSLIDNYAN